MVEAVDHLNTREVDGLLYLGRSPADRDQRLAQVEPSDGGNGGVEQRGAAEGEQLLRLAESAGRAGGQNQSGDLGGGRIDHAVDVSEHYGGVVYGIALSVAACLRGGTRVDVAWNLDPGLTPAYDPTEAVAITPGGGRLGSLLGGALDSRLVELSLAESTEARIVPCELNSIEASAIGVDAGTTIRIVFAPASVLPEAVWQPLLEREPVGVTATHDADRLRDFALGGVPSSTNFFTTDGRFTGEWSPTPSLILFGGGPMADALMRAGEFVGWNVERMGGVDHAIGIAATLSPIDGLIVMGHDTEPVGRVLQAALGSRVGYIGSIGPQALQEDRGDWLAYRGVTDTSRVHGPAGFPIGASSPEEVALSVVCEMISVRSGGGS